MSPLVSRLILIISCVGLFLFYASTTHTVRSLVASSRFTRRWSPEVPRWYRTPQLREIHSAGPLESWRSSLFADDFHLTKRDVCSDALPGTVSSTCTPGRTLCCVKPDEIFPRCQNFINQGFCCVASGGACYADLDSNCDDNDSVTCPTPGGSSDVGCCPQYTTCAGEFNQSSEGVRCEINISGPSTIALSGSTSSSASPSSSTSATFSTSTEVVTPTDTPTPAALSPASEDASPSAPSTLSGGAIAGIAIGPMLALLTGFAIWFLLHRRAKGRTNARNPTNGEHDTMQPLTYPAKYDPDSFHSYELQSQGPRLAELGESRPAELQGSPHRYQSIRR